MRGLPMKLVQSIRQRKPKCPKCGGTIMITKKVLNKRYCTCNKCKRKYIMIDDEDL